MLPPYVLIEHPTALKDKTLILQTSPPYCIGQVWRFQGKDWDEWINRNPRTPICIITGYRMHVSFYATLDGRTADTSMITDALHDMRDFYISERITRNAPRFNRYKIDEYRSGI